MAAIDNTAAVAHRRRHARHPRLALGHALRPTAPAHFGQHPVGEFRLRQHGLSGGARRCGPAALWRPNPPSSATAPRPEPYREGPQPVPARPRRPARCPRGGTAARSRRWSRAAAGSTAAPAASSGSLTWAASSVTAGPSRQRPSSSRASRRCTSSAAASRYVVALGRPVRSHSSASPQGDSAIAVQYAHGFVEDADAAMLSHKEILASRILRSSPD